MERESSIHPNVQAKMDMWDNRTGRRSRENGTGPLSRELRERIGNARRRDASDTPLPRRDGEPLSAELRRKISLGRLRHNQNKQR